MKLCPKCNAQFTDAVFCQNCGTAVEDAAFCTNCGKITPLKHQFCQYCGAVRTEDGEFVARPVAPAKEPIAEPVVEPVVAEPIVETVAEPTVEPVIESVAEPTTEAVEEIPVAVAVAETVETPVEATEEVELAEVVDSANDEYIEIDTTNIEIVEKPKKKKLSKKAIIISSISLFLVAAIVVGLFFFLPKKEKQYNFVLYLKDGELMFNNLDINKGEWQLSKSLLEYTVENDEYSTVGWSVADFTLMSKNGKYIFYPDKMEKGTSYVNLYYRDAKNPNADAKKVAEEVRGYFVNDDATIVTYLNKDKQVYQYFIGKDKEEKIANDVIRFNVSNDGKTVLYINNDKTLYAKKSGKDKEKLSADVTDIEAVNEKFDTVYYTKDDVLYKQVIGKDKEKIDDNLYGIGKLYDSGEMYYVKYNTKTVNAWDYVEDDMAEYDANITIPSYPEYPDYYDYYTSSYYYSYFDSEGYQAALDKYYEEYDKYWEAYELYQSKSQRDYLREELQSSNIKVTTYSLYYYDGKEEHKVSSKDISCYVNCAEDKPVAIYEITEIAKTKLTSITSVSDLENRLSYSGARTVSYGVASKEKELELEHDNIYSMKVTTSGNTVYYIVKDDGADYTDEGELYKATIKNNKISKTEEYDEASYISAADDKNVCYFKEYSGEDTDLYLNKELVAEDVCDICSTDLDKKVIIYGTDYSKEDHTETIHIYKDGKTKEVAEDVYDCEILPDGRIVYLCDYSRTLYTGELRIYDNGKDEKIDDDVSRIIVPYSNNYGGNVTGWVTP